MSAPKDYAKAIDVLNMPDRIRALNVSPNGFPVPWFVVWYDGNGACQPGQGLPDFRVADTNKLRRAGKENLCWVCGGKTGIYKAFCIGPMCAITRTISEPPQHRDCAIWSAKNCPFLCNPAMRRNEKGMLEDGRLRPGLIEPGGNPILRNPGAICVWITKTFKMFRPHTGNDGVLFRIGDPFETLWFAEGRRATLDEIKTSIDSGYPKLEEMARDEGPHAMAELVQYRERAMKLLPQEIPREDRRRHQ
jgi:hypothetical protein